jgi:D-beta-D-heptose 7-phosphate kinase/D-beta-D-heptose 1-phosphate adenosyltransferase
MIKKDRLKLIVNAFKGRLIPVIGDLVADIYQFNRVERISREAPVLIVSYRNETVSPGCAGNVVGNLVRLGAKPLPIGWVGSDLAGNAIIKTFESWDVPVDRIAVDSSRPTPSKTRILADDLNTPARQILRIDRGCESNIPIKFGKTMADRISSLPDYSIPGRPYICIVSDYGCGTMGETARMSLTALRRQQNMKLFVDSRFNLADYWGADTVLPNEPEALAITGRKQSEIPLEALGIELKNKLSVKIVVLTLGNRGLALFHSQPKPTMIPSYQAAEVVDTTGAGDTVTAVFTLAMVSGADPVEAATLANIASGITVSKPRTLSPTVDELLVALENLEPRGEDTVDQHKGK